MHRNIIKEQKYHLSRTGQNFHLISFFKNYVKRSVNKKLFFQKQSFHCNTRNEE